MADDSLSSTAPQGTEGEQTKSELSIGETSGGVSARKTGKNEVTLDINVPAQQGDVMQKITRSARGPAAAAAMATAATAAPAQEPVDIFDDAKVERTKPQTIPNDLPKEGRDFNLAKEPTSIYNDDQAAAAHDLLQDRSQQNPYFKTDDALALKDADIGQGADSDDAAGGIAAIDADGNIAPPTISPDEQEDSAAQDLAQNQAETTQAGRVNRTEESTAKNGGNEKIDLSRGSHAGMITKIPGVSTLLDKADSLVQKEPGKAAKIYGRLAFMSKNFERFSAIKNIVEFVVFTSETIVIPIILILLSPVIVPILLVILFIAPQWLSPDTQAIHDLTKFFEERKSKAEARQKQLRNKKKALAQANRFNGSAGFSNQSPN